MEQESSAGAADLGIDGDTLDREQLRATFEALQLACASEGTSVQALFAKPAIHVIEFAHAHALDIRELRDICELLIRRLDALDEAFAATARLQSN